MLNRCGFWGKKGQFCGEIITFGWWMITFEGPQCMWTNPSQKSRQGSDPPPPFRQCLHFGSIWSGNPSLILQHFQQHYCFCQKIEHSDFLWEILDPVSWIQRDGSLCKAKQTLLRVHHNWKWHQQFCDKRNPSMGSGLKYRTNQNFNEIFIIYKVIAWTKFPLGVW